MLLFIHTLPVSDLLISKLSNHVRKNLIINIHKYCSVYLQTAHCDIFLIYFSSSLPSAASYQLALQQSAFKDTHYRSTCFGAGTCLVGLVLYQGMNIIVRVWQGEKYVRFSKFVLVLKTTPAQV